MTYNDSHVKIPGWSSLDTFASLTHLFRPAKSFVHSSDTTVDRETDRVSYLIRSICYSIVMVNSYESSRPGLLRRFGWWFTHPKALMLRILGELYRRTRPAEPWISYKAVRFCEVILHSEMIGYEWGSGNSTLWFGKRLKKLTSIEHSSHWYRVISEEIKRQKITNIDYHLIPLEHPPHLPTFPRYDSPPQYVRAIEEFSSEPFDFIAVDGHYRMACVQAALFHLKPGGLLLIDNTEWLNLEKWGVPPEWKLLHHSQGFESATAIWQKPLY